MDELAITITDDEKKEILSLLQALTTKHLEVFVVAFYENFLNKQTYNFLHKSSNEELINMFSSFLNIIASHLAEPYNLDEHLEVLREKHQSFKELISYSDIFIKAFLKALTKIFTTLDDSSVKSWSALLENFLSFFKNNF